TRREARSASTAGAASAIHPASLLFLAIWLGLATAWVELAVVFVRWRFVDATALGALQLNQHALWMGPLSHASLFGAGGLLLATVRAFTRRRRVASLGVFGLCFLSAYSLLLTYRGLSSLANSALAGGLAFRTTLFVLRHP